MNIWMNPFLCFTIHRRTSHFSFHLYQTKPWMQLEFEGEGLCGNPVRAFTLNCTNVSAITASWSGWASTTVWDSCFCTRARLCGQCGWAAWPEHLCMLLWRGSSCLSAWFKRCLPFCVPFLSTNVFRWLNVKEALQQRGGPRHSRHYSRKYARLVQWYNAGATGCQCAAMPCGTHV